MLRPLHRSLCGDACSTKGVVRAALAVARCAADPGSSAAAAQRAVWRCAVSACRTVEHVRRAVDCGRVTAYAHEGVTRPSRLRARQLLRLRSVAARPCMCGCWAMRWLAAVSSAATSGHSSLVGRYQPPSGRAESGADKDAPSPSHSTPPLAPRCRCMRTPARRTPSQPAKQYERHGPAGMLATGSRRKALPGRSNQALSRPTAAAQHNASHLTSRRSSGISSPAAHTSSVASSLRPARPRQHGQHTLSA